MSEAEGDKHWKAAQKLTSASFLSFRLKSDWEQAGPLYEKAANCYRARLLMQQAKAWDKAREACELAAKCATRQDSPWHAAKHLERAADAARSSNDLTLAVDYLKQASLAYREAGRAQSAAEALSKGARWLEERNPQAAGELLAEAVEEVESEDKVGMSLDLYRQAIGTFIRGERFAEAVGMLMRFATACDSAGSTSSQCKAYLGAIIVWLYAQNGSQAWAVYQDALGVDAFSTSEQAIGAERLLEAYRSGDPEAVRKSIASQSLFLDLDNQVARLAKKLPTGDVRATGKCLGSAVDGVITLDSSVPKVSAEDLDEDDLT